MGKGIAASGNDVLPGTGLRRPTPSAFTNNVARIINISTMGTTTPPPPRPVRGGICHLVVLLSGRNGRGQLLSSTCACSRWGHMLLIVGPTAVGGKSPFPDSPCKSTSTPRGNGQHLWLGASGHGLGKLFESKKPTGTRRRAALVKISSCCLLGSFHRLKVGQVRTSALVLRMSDTSGHTWASGQARSRMSMLWSAMGHDARRQ